MKALLLITTLISFEAFALPQLPLIDPMQRLQDISKNNGADYEGIVKLSNCSGALVIFKGMPKTKNALIMTNGHCIKMMKLGEFVLNQPVSRSVSVFDSAMKLHPLDLQKVVYATMTDTDVAFYEATKSYAEIETEAQVEALVLEDTAATVGTKLDVISGYWEEITSCEAEAIIPLLKEGSWLWKDSVRYTKECMTRGGFSGSPVIERGTKSVVGIHNTGNNGKTDCSNNNPCEVNNPQMETYRRYAQQTYMVYSCLNETFDLDLTIEGCNLPK
jgi:V8-like Glu-specific endopeptidase